MAPIVHGLEAEYSGRLNFIYLDIDNPRNEQIKKQLDFRYQPQFLLIDGQGNVLQQWFGIVSADDFRFAFDTYVQ